MRCSIRCSSSRRMLCTHSSSSSGIHPRACLSLASENSSSTAPRCRSCHTAGSLPSADAASGTWAPAGLDLPAVTGSGSSRGLSQWETVAMSSGDGGGAPLDKWSAFCSACAPTTRAIVPASNRCSSMTCRHPAGSLSPSNGFSSILLWRPPFPATCTADSRSYVPPIEAM